VLLRIASVKWITGDYRTARLHAAEVQMLSKLDQNLHHEARAVWMGAICSIRLGNLQQAIEQLHRSKLIIDICGLGGGAMDQQILLVQGSVHLLKSESTQARGIYSQIVETNSADQNALSYALSLLNIAHIDTMCGETEDSYGKLHKAQDVFRTSISPEEIIYCNMVEANIDLTVQKFDLAKVKF
jgi:hypothetical protein